MKTNKINFNLKWWKFDKYEWHNHEELGQIIRPSKDAKYTEYNPWDLNEKKKSSNVYKLPIYGSLLSEINAAEYEKIVLDLKFHSVAGPLDREKYKVEPIEELEAKKIKVEAHIKRQILSFVEEYGLLGVFFNYANKMVCPTTWHPIFEFKKTDFSNNKKKSDYFSSELYKIINETDGEYVSLDFNFLEYFYKDTIGRSYHDVLFDYYDNKKIPDNLYIKTILPIHHVDFFDGAEWKRTQIKAKLNEKGLKYFDGKNFDELINSGKYKGIVDNNFLDKNSQAGFFYNTIIPPIDSEWAKSVKRPYFEVTNRTPREYFVPLEKQSYYFKKKEGTDFVLPSVLLAHVNSPLKVWDNKGKSHDIDKKSENYADYFESLADIIRFVKALQDATREENKKKSIAEGTYDFRPEDNTNNLSDSVDLNKNAYLDIFIRRNYTRTNYSNIENPISFRSPSLAGIIAEMFLRDKLDGQQYKKCAHTKCNRWSIMKDNQLYCKKPRTCEQKANYLKRKKRKDNL